jgi:hypothetical protein
MMRWLLAALIAASFLGRPALASAESFIPSTADSAEIQRLTDTYFKLLDNRDYAAAYAMQTPGMQATMPFHEWLAVSQQSRQQMGDLQERKQAKVTWYLDPPDSPGPGLYAAVDFVSRYANSRQHSEYLIWFRKKKPDAFMLTRHETTFLVDQVSNADTDSMPAAGAQPVASLPKAKPLEEAEGDVIGFQNVDTARSALTARQGTKTQLMEDGWVVIHDSSDRSIWSFTPAEHPAHPAVVKRYVYEENGHVMLGMKALCQAGKSACDQLIRQFQEMNEQLTRKMHSDRKTDP